ncbi:MAG: creatininase family protein [Thermoplasmata archaeon]|nr:creatininase family protein [Thermoplasmata archaeon]
MKFSDLNWKEVERLDKDTIFFLTIGPIEAHGPHLPVATDFLIAKRVEEEVIKRIDYKSIVLPSIPFSTCKYLATFPGSISVSWHSIYKILLDIMKNLAFHDFKYLVICNFHMDLWHLKAIYKAIFKVKKYGIRACEPISASYFNKKIFDDIEGEIHADEKETSLALYLFPELVGDYKSLKSFKVKIGLKDAFKNFKKLGANDGYIGSPSNADKEKGKKYFEKLVNACIEGIEKMREGRIEFPEKLKVFLKI